LLLGVIQIPILPPLQPGHRPDWLTPDVILVTFLPALVVEGSVKLDVRELLRNFVPLLLLAGLVSCSAADYFERSSNRPKSILRLFGSNRN
jgi:NhaP-type Na+/H+ or K+/H+ antiporter